MFAADFRKIAREALKGKWLRTALVLLLAGLLGAGAGIGGFNTNVEYRMQYQEMGVSLEQFRQIVAVAGMITIAVSLLAIFVGSIVQVGMFNMGRRVLDGEKARPGMLFPRGIYWKAVGLNLLTLLFVSLWSLLFVIPGIIAGYSYAMAPYIMAQNPGIGPMDAIRLSKQKMRGRRMNLFCLELSFIGWLLLSMLPLEILMVIAVIGGEMGTGLVLIGVGALLTAVGGIFVNAYMHISVCAFLRHADETVWTPPQQPAADAFRSETQAEAEEAGGEAEEGEGGCCASDRRFTRLTADETVAKDVFMQHGCSRRRLRAEGMLEEYEALGVDVAFEISWIREYGRALMYYFDSNPAMLDHLLNLAGEYAMDDLLDRVLERIDRHIRQTSLPDEQILNMLGRTIALIRSGIFADKEGFVQRKLLQANDMADRLEHRLNESDSDGAWRKAMELLRGMCAAE